MKTASFSRAVAAVILSACAVAGAIGAESMPPAQFFARVAGVYKESLPGRLGTDGPLSENILEVVPVDEGHAYIRVQLELRRGAMGSIYGIAAYNGRDSLVYDNGKGGSEQCALALTWTKLAVSTLPTLRKTRGCRDYAAAHGAPDKISFVVARRRDITYLQGLKDSREFKAAMDEYRAHSPEARRADKKAAGI